MAQDKFLSQPFVKIGGKNLPQELHDAILQVVVDTSLFLPEMFMILIRDPELKWIDDKEFFDLGKEVDISAKSGEDLGGEEGHLMKGEITALEPMFLAEGEMSFIVRGYSKAHRLHRGKKSRTFLKRTDSDIVQKIAGEVGLKAIVDSTSVRHDYVIQSNQTNMEFLQARAARLGYKVFATDKELHFKKGEATLGEGPEVSFKDNTLREFRPILATTHQPDKVTVMSWDMKQKKVIKAEASLNSALNQGGIGKPGGEVAKSAFGAAEMVVVNQNVATPDEAKALAKGIANDLSNEFIQAEGVCYGNPKVRAGYTLTIKGVGNRFSGKYFITAATHTLEGGSFETHFTISGRQPNTLSSLLGTDQQNGYHTHSTGPGRVQGVVTAIVTNNKDDAENLGRVKVQYPWMGDNMESDWVRIAAPGAGDQRGIFWLPEVNDEVLVAFEHGDFHRPYIIGGLWNSQDKPAITNKEALKGGKVIKRVLKSRSGHVITFDDTEGSEKIQIVDKSGSNKVIIDTKSGTITVESEKTIGIQAGSQKVTLDGKGQAIQMQGGGRMVTMKNGQVQIT